MKKLIGPVSNILNKILFPEKCIGCKKFGKSICEVCILKIKESKQIDSTWIISKFSYKDKNLSSLIYQLKYKNKKNALNDLFKTSAQKIKDWEKFKNKNTWTVVPVPTSSSKLRVRGFNQAEIIAKGILEFLPDETQIETKGLSRKNSISQTKTESKKARIQNVAGAYTVTNTELFSGKNILIIDDVLTTGATLNEIRKILKASGAKDVIAFTLGH